MSVENVDGLPESNAVLTLRTLGEAGAVFHPPGASEPRELGMGKPLAVLVYLSAAPGYTASREHLVDLLWSDVETDAGKHALRQSLWYLRRRLGDDLFRTEGDRITLAVQLRSDRDLFLASVDRRDLEAAVAAYGGDFLAAFASPGGAEYERWVDLERRRLRSAFIRCSESLVRQQLSLSRFREALALARRVQLADPYSELAWRLVLECLISSSDWVSAASEADRLEHFLKSEEIEAEPATRGLLRVARRAPSTVEPGDERRGGLMVDLIGREAEFAQILGRWESARGGTARFLHLIGTAGLGKSRLLNDVHSRLRVSRGRPVLVRASPGERSLAFSFAADVVAALAALPGAAAISPDAAAALIALNPVLSSTWSAATDTSTGDEALRRRAIAVAELVRAVSEDAPAVLLLDDVHWSDSASLQLLGLAFGKIEGTRTLVVAASRLLLGDGFDEIRWERLALTPLSAAHIGELLANLGPLPVGATWAENFAHRLHQATDGSPLLVLETLQLALERQVLSLDDTGWRCTDAAALSRELSDGRAMQRRIASLGREEGRLFLLVALAGVPILREVLASALQQEITGLDARLFSLEQRGLVEHLNTGWTPTHDEIGAIAIQMAPGEERRTAHALLGRGFAENGPHPLAARLAADHLRLAGDVDALQRVFSKVLHSARQSGDRRATVDISRELLGMEAPAEDVRSVANRAPFGLRTRMRPMLAVAALLLATIAIMGYRVFVSPAGGDRTSGLWLFTREGDRDAIVELTLDPEHWPAAGTLDIRRDGHTARLAWTPPLGTSRVVSLSGGRWVTYRPYPDSGGIDVFLRSPTRGEERLTFSPGDDFVEDVSPDGATLILTTGRWDRRGHDNLALFDLGTRAVTRLTHADSYDSGARWSPDGSRIAFGRRYFVNRAPSTCVIDVDGSHEQCFPTAEGQTSSPIGWLDARRLAVVVKNDSSSALLEVDATDGVERSVLRDLSSAELSPDGRWLLIESIATDRLGRRTSIAPADRPEDAHTFELPRGVEARRHPVWSPVRAPRRDYIDRVRIERSAQAVPLDMPYALTLRAFDASGRPVNTPCTRWHGLDPDVAQVSQEGIVSAKRQGALRVVATACGWRADTAALTIGRPQSSLLLRESWGADFGRTWQPFGEPMPRRVESGARAHSLAVNGDSSFTSGVYLRQPYSVAHGLSARATISTPMTALQWQMVRLELRVLPDALLRDWDHRIGGLPPAIRECGAGSPANEGYPGAERLRFNAPPLTRMVPSTKAQRSGVWYTLEIQIFPDGRCGFAVDGTPRFVSRPSFETTDSVRAVVHGMSFGTHILVGPVELYDGIRPGIDWAAFERNRPPPPR